MQDIVANISGLQDVTLKQEAPVFMAPANAQPANLAYQVEILPQDTVVHYFVGQAVMLTVCDGDTEQLGELEQFVPVLVELMPGEPMTGLFLLMSDLPPVTE